MFDGMVLRSPGEGGGDADESKSTADADSQDGEGDDKEPKPSRRQKASEKLLREILSGQSEINERLDGLETRDEDKASEAKSKEREKLKDKNPDKAVAELEGENRNLDTSLKAQTRRNDLLEAASEADVEGVSRSLLLKLLPVFDEEKDGKESPEDLVKRAVEYLTSQTASKGNDNSEGDDDSKGEDENTEETKSFGAGGGKKIAGTAQAQKITELVKLGVAAQSGKRHDTSAYLDYKRELTKAKIPIPSDLSKRIMRAADGG